MSTSPDAAKRAGRDRVILADEMAAQPVAPCEPAETNMRDTPDTPIYHPHPDEHGRPFRLTAPSQECDLDRLADPRASVTFIPGSACAGSLNGVALAHCSLAEIEHAQASMDAEPVDEPPFVLPGGKQAAAGAVVLEADGRIWLVSPSNAFGGYTTTFPKGRASPGVSLQATALRETWEESGLRIRLTGWLGDFSRTQTHTRFYLARRVGGHPADMGWESQAVHLATPAQARALLNRATDQAVLKAFVRLDPQGRGQPAP
jgi:ADP-ribose pyrophosphatase YjhB (NUDIX family)